ncbi:hypothetical protein GGI43DRAFT_411958 [Trichoderma evansii]
MLCESPATHAPVFPVYFLYYYFFSPPNLLSPLLTALPSSPTKSPGILPPLRNQHARFALWGRQEAIRAIWLRIRIAQLLAVAQTAGTKIC